jgi:hypothetical protein
METTSSTSPRDIGVAEPSRGTPTSYWDTIPALHAKLNEQPFSHIDQSGHQNNIGYIQADYGIKRQAPKHHTILKKSGRKKQPSSALGLGYWGSLSCAPDISQLPVQKRRIQKPTCRVRFEDQADLEPLGTFLPHPQPTHGISPDHQSNQGTTQEHIYNDLTMKHHHEARLGSMMSGRQPTCGALQEELCHHGIMDHYREVQTLPVDVTIPSLQHNYEPFTYHGDEEQQPASSSKEDLDPNIDPSLESMMFPWQVFANDKAGQT